jgi:5-methylcytosine-specific restriction endonuclease McrA
MARHRHKSKIAEREKIKKGRTEALKRQNGFCFYCYEPITFLEATADHKIPKSKGGSNLEFNINAVCNACNQAKKDKSHAVYLKEIKLPNKNGDLELLLAWSRRKIWLKAHRSCRSIYGIFDLEPKIPPNMLLTGGSK